MKHTFELVGVNEEGVEVLAFVLHVTQRQAERVFYAMAYAMASDGGWKHARLSLVTESGQRKQLNAANFVKGAANG